MEAVELSHARANLAFFMAKVSVSVSLKDQRAKNDCYRHRIPRGLVHELPFRALYCGRELGNSRARSGLVGNPFNEEERARCKAAYLGRGHAHLSASGQMGIIDGTEIQVRRPAAGPKNREKDFAGVMSSW